MLRLFCLVITYPAFVLMLFKQEIPLWGILYSNARLFSPQAVDFAYYSYMVGVGLVLMILWPIRNELYEYKRINMSRSIRLILFIGMILSACFVLNSRFFPNRFSIDGVIIVTETPYVVFNVLLLISRKDRSSLSSLCHLFFLIGMIMIGERVGSIVTVVILLAMNGKDIIKEQVNKKVLYLGFPALFILGSIVGFSRIDFDFSIEDVISQFYSQSTTCDVLYVYLCSVEYYLQNGITPTVLGSLLLGGLIPGKYYGVSSDYYFSNFLNHHFADNFGGGLFFSEGMIAFGFWGVLLYLSFATLFFKYFFTCRGGGR